MFRTSDECLNGISIFDCRLFSSSVNKKELGELSQQLEVKYKHIYIQMGIEKYDVSQCQKANSRDVILNMQVNMLSN